jgi:GNAT superfamily N-acetyltransferase
MLHPNARDGADICESWIRAIGPPQITATASLGLVYNDASENAVFRTLPMLLIRPATIEDVPLLFTLIHELAEYDRLAHEASVTEEDLTRDGFGPRPKFRVVIAEWDGEPAGYALFFEFYSTFQGRAGLFLDDLFVRPHLRKNGVGRALLAHVAGIAWKEKYFCMRWEVLDWNAPAIKFYSDMGAVFLDEWKSAVLIGDPLQAVAEEAR